MSMFAALCLALTVPLSTPKVGLCLSVKDGAVEEDFIGAMRQQIRMGLDGGVISLKWDEYESQGGKPLVDGLNAAKLMGQDVMVNFSSIDTLRRRQPADVLQKAWTDAEMWKRSDEFLSKACEQFGKNVRWVSLGNEVDAYFRQHPDEVESYITYLAHSREVIHKARPDILVGVTVTCLDSIKSPDVAKKLQDGMDVTIFTYYPMEGFHVLDIDKVPSHFDFMMATAGSRPLILQEIGYPASPLNGGSDQKQSEFVHAVFGQLDRFSARIPLASYFMQTDFSPAMLKVFETYYGSADPQFTAFLGTLGLSDTNGKPRPALATFKYEVLKRKPL